jgi:GT2 family glycosyltransferase
MKAPRISICIVNWEATPFLRACLESIRTHPPSCEYETIVVDNASRDFDAQAMAVAFAGVRWILNSTNAGYAPANNQAAVQTSGRYLMLLNPDTEVTEGSLDRLAAFLDEHPQAGAAAPRLVFPDGRTQQSCRGFPDPWPLFGEAVGLARLLPNHRVLGAYRMHGFDHQSTQPVDQPMFSAIMIRRETWNEVGPLDERFPIFFNDVDWCMRAKELGWGIHFVAEASVVHHYGQSTKHMGRALVRESHRSLVELYKKHYRNRMSRPGFALAIGLIRLAGRLRTV